ncbi:MAG: alkaline shock response membrane anchor protein AmaP [Kiritimatiellae bacterium]|nr:alkaline shock response membrane anchor protein AmaP [Kiritimatiellia bacterium]
MKSLRLVAGFLFFGVVIILATFLLSTAIPSEDMWAHFVEKLFGERITVIAWNLAILILMVVFLITRMQRPRGEQFLSFDNEGGSVSITLKAVSDFLGRLTEEFAAVSSLKPIVRVVNQQLDIRIDLKVKAGTKILELCQVLQSRVREIVQDNLGFSDVHNVAVNVRDIVGVVSVSEPVPQKPDE